MEQDQEPKKRYDDIRLTFSPNKKILYLQKSDRMYVTSTKFLNYLFKGRIKFLYCKRCNQKRKDLFTKDSEVGNIAQGAINISNTNKGGK